MLPWRVLPGERADPYAVLVSEIMLQQTTVAVVKKRFESFLRRFPTAGALAAAPLDEVLQEWAGLGYYRRARALHACAGAICARHDGMVPHDLQALRALPGLGAYTAAAVAAIAFETAAVPVDGNVERVLARLAAVETPFPPARKAINRLAAALAAEDRAGDFAQAVMELGALVCTPRRPACLECPWRPACLAHASGDPARLPVRAARLARPVRGALVFVVRDGAGRLLLQRRPETGLLAGMVVLPGSSWESDAAGSPEEVAAQAPVSTGWMPVAGQVVHVFTHLELRMRLFAGKVETGMPAPEGMFWSERLDGLALPSLTVKVLRHAGIGAGKPAVPEPRDAEAAGQALLPV